MSLRVVLADDQRIVREGLALVLRGIPGIELVGAAADGAEALRLIDQLRPDVVLMDLRMPVLDGVEATGWLRAEHPEVQVVVLTTYTDETDVFTALRAGARGYLTKDASIEEIAAAITTVAAGDAQLAPAAQARLLDALDRLPARPPPPAGANADGLTAREREVLRLIAAGLSNTEIAAGLHLSETTVKTHVNRIFAKTGSRDRAQAVAYAYRTGLA